jgi:hypothetical protein
MYALQRPKIFYEAYQVLIGGGSNQWQSFFFNPDPSVNCLLIQKLFR